MNFIKFYNGEYVNLNHVVKMDFEKSDHKDMSKLILTLDILKTNGTITLDLLTIEYFIFDDQMQKLKAQFDKFCCARQVKL